MESPKLTARQQQIFDLVQTTIERTGAPPTRAEIAAQLGFKSPNAAEEHLQALARKGVIELVGGTSRGIRLPRGTLRAVNEARSKQFSLPLASLAQLSLPLVGRVAAGSPILAQEHIDQTYVLEASLFARRPDYLLRVKGMSMRDAGIMDGDLLAVQKTSEARNGQIVVARLGDDVTVKRLQRTADGVELLPENPDFQPIRVGAEEPFELEGIAVGLVRQSVSASDLCATRRAMPIKSPKAASAAECQRLEQLPNVGPAMAGDLRALGIHHPTELARQDPLQLYRQLERLTGKRQDPCVLDTFMAVVDFMQGAEPRPWWDYTPLRKRQHGNLSIAPAAQAA